MRLSNAVARTSPIAGSIPKHTRAAIVAAFIAGAIAPPAAALDPGEDGVRVTIPVTGLSDAAQAVAVDPDGNLVMAGSDSGGHSILASITRTGAMNGWFGAGGIVVDDLAVNQADGLRAIARTNDARYVACGYAFSAGTATDFVTARFVGDGSLDGTFDGVGYAVTSYLQSGPGGSLYDQCNAVAVDADGSVVSAGLSYQDGPSRVALARHTAGGLPDASFVGGGKVVIDASQSSNGNSEAHAVLIQPDGRILVAGFAGGQFNSEFLLMRLEADGTPDASFGTLGIVRTPIGTGEDIANAMVLQPDGRIVLAGSATAADGRRDFALARFTSTGVLDATFGSGGIVTTPIGPGDDVAYALTLMPWGRLVAAGSARISTSASGRDLAVAAYNADGTLDRYFGALGVRMLDVSATAEADDIAYGLANDIDGEHFWAVGTASPAGNGDFLAIEFGLPDTIFRHGFNSNTAP
jgi:uncharacterized delta-60 repeat protein